MSSEGAAAASAAARRRGAAKLQARAPEEDTPRRPRAMDQTKARTTMPSALNVRAQNFHPLRVLIALSNALR